MIKPEVLDALVAAGCTAEQIAAAVKADQARSSGAGRQARYRANKRAKEAVTNNERDVTSVTVTDDVPPKKEIPPTPPKEKTTPSSISEARASSIETRARFDQFWAIFPNKVGKRDAESAFLNALKRADLATIIDGVRRYAAKTDDRPWCNPATFLNQDRWTDNPAPQPMRAATGPPKPKTLGDMFRDDAKRMGIIPDDKPTDPTNGRLETSDRIREGGGTGIARRFAIEGDVVGNG